MTETPAEVPPDKTLAIEDALIAFTGAIGEALPDICSYGLTLGESYVPFDPDPEDECDQELSDDEDFICNQAWVRVTSVGLANQTEEEGFGGDITPTTLTRLGLEVGILRCVEIPEDGEAPKASDVMVAALQSMRDMAAIQCAALETEVWAAILLGTWTPLGPLGGQYGGMWTFDVEI